MWDPGGGLKIDLFSGMIGVYIGGMKRTWLKHILANIFRNSDLLINFIKFREFDITNISSRKLNVI